MRRVLVVSVFVCWMFTALVDFILTPSASLVPLMQGDNIGLLCFCGFVESWLPLLFSPCFRWSPAGEGVKSVLCNLYSVISMVSAPMTIGFTRSSIRSMCVVATGLVTPQAVRIKNEKLRIKNFSFIVFCLIVCATPMGSRGRRDSFVRRFPLVTSGYYFVCPF